MYNRLCSFLFKDIVLRHLNTVYTKSLYRQMSMLLLQEKNNLFNTKPIFSSSGSSVRFYAKNKDKKKEKGKKKIEINETQLSEVINLPNFKLQIQKSIDTLKNDFIKNLSVRSATGTIESIHINLDGKEYILQELAQIIRKNPHTIVINVTAFPQAIPTILKSIENSGMNLNPQQDGTTIYIPIPKLTTEHRENMAKSAKSFFIKCKDNIRTSQNTQVKKIKQNINLSEDEKYVIQQQIINICDQYIFQAENLLQIKQNEILGK